MHFADAVYKISLFHKHLPHYTIEHSYDRKIAYNPAGNLQWLYGAYFVRFITDTTIDSIGFAIHVPIS